MPPRSPRWISSITKGTNEERLWLLKAEHWAEQEILQAAVDVRLGLSDGALVDCTDLVLLPTKVRWCRWNRRIYARFSVRLRGWKLSRTVQLRSPRRG